MWKIKFWRKAQKDAEKIAEAGLKETVSELIEILKNNPYQTPPSYEKLKGDLAGLLSRRINKKHRLVYQVYKKEKIVKIISLWSHYE